ncbi:MAG: sporulation protein YqfD [Clostridia bacterium]|nr:sporulation protein YqfD [Clostridia bacterium]
MKNKIRINVSNCSPTTVLNLLYANGIIAKDISRTSATSVEFTIYKKMHANLLGILNEKCYNVSVVKNYGIQSVFDYIIKRLGVVVGVFIVIASAIIFSKFTFYINVMGNNSVPTDSIIECIASYGIKKGKINTFETDKLEKYIIENIQDISLVSVTSVGNTITINVKEKLPQITNTYSSITAPYNMLITSIDVISGTPSVKVGDIVKKGDVLINPYYLDHNGTKLQCEAIGKVVGDTWFCASSNFEENIVESVRTGKKLTNSEYYLGTKKLFATNKHCSFDSFEIEYKKENLFNGLFIPLNINYTIYYEVQFITTHREFADYEDILKQETYNKASKCVPEGFEIIENNTTVNKVGNNYVVSTYLKSVVEVNNAN